MQPNVEGIPDIDFAMGGAQGNMGSVTDFLLQGGHTNIPWKLTSHSPEVSASMMGTFIDRGVPIMDDHTVAAIMQGQMQVPPQMQVQPSPSFMDWANLGYKVVAPSTYGNAQTTPSHSHGHGQNVSGQAMTPSAHFGNNQAGPSHSHGQNGLENGNGQAISQRSTQYNPQAGPSHGPTNNQLTPRHPAYGNSRELW